MNELNLWEKSDKRKVTNMQDSVNNADTEFAFFSFHINSVGITLASIVVMILIFVLRNVSVKCMRSVWRKVCNCADPSKPRPTPYGRAGDPVMIVPNASRVPIIPNTRTNTLYPELEPYVYRPLQEDYPGYPGQYPVNSQVPTAPVVKSTSENMPVNSDSKEKASTVVTRRVV